MSSPRALALATALGLCLVVASGCDDKSKSAAPAANRSPATAPLDYLAVQGQAKRHSEKVISVAQVQQAIQQFKAMEERLPKSLDELVAQHYLGSVPVPGRGQKFLYNPRDGSVRVVAAP